MIYNNNNNKNNNNNNNNNNNPSRIMILNMALKMKEPSRWTYI